MDNLDVKQILNNAKIWILRVLTGGRKRPKLPRKKIQLQFDEVETQFTKHIKQLEKRLEQTDIYPSTKLAGEKLLEEVKRFEELEIVTINKKRIDQIASPLLHPVDISLWTIYQMHNYVEEIYHFIRTMEVVDL